MINGELIDLVAGDYEARIASSGAMLVHLRHQGRDLIMPFDAEATLPAGWQGKTLLPWANRIAGSRYDYAGTEFLVGCNEPASGSALHGLAGWMDWQAGAVKPYVSVVLLETMTYEGGAHPLNYVKGITLNAAGKVVTLADLKAAMPSLSVEALRDAAARECTARHISTEEAEKITEFPKEFYIGNNGHLYFIFQQYDIAPYSEGWIMADMGLFPF